MSNFYLTNLENKTVWLNKDLVSSVEADSSKLDAKAILTMSDGRVIKTNEYYEELLEEWGINKLRPDSIE